MRVFVMFDLPVLTVQQRRDYRYFRKFLVKSGFIMMQESIYTKLCLNTTAAKVVKENVKKHTPKEGVVELMIVTEKQYTSIEYLLGKASDEFVDTIDRVVVL